MRLVGRRAEPSPAVVGSVSVPGGVLEQVVGDLMLEIDVVHKNDQGRTAPVLGLGIVVGRRPVDNEGRGWRGDAEAEHYGLRAIFKGVGVSRCGSDFAHAQAAFTDYVVLPPVPVVISGFLAVPAAGGQSDKNNKNSYFHEDVLNHG